jgi:hypothetical protein
VPNVINIRNMFTIGSKLKINDLSLEFILNCRHETIIEIITITGKDIKLKTNTNSPKSALFPELANIAGEKRAGTMDKRPSNPKMMLETISHSLRYFCFLLINGSLHLTFSYAL